MRRRILVIPAVADLDALSRLLTHIGHYFAHVEAEHITVLVESNLLDEAQAWLRSPSPPPAFDERVMERVIAVRPVIELMPWPSSLEPVVLASDLVLDWDVRASTREPWSSARAGFRRNRTLFEVDWQATRLGAAWLAEAARILVQGRQAGRSDAERFVELGERLGETARAYLVGTGPSARRALEHDLSDGIRIVCNTIILDDELMEHVRPHVLTFADPIFHFGPSTYAQRFQRALVEQAERQAFTVVTTDRYAPLLRAHVPEIADRVIGLRQGTDRWPDNFDLFAHPAVRPYPNVLTMLMLPIAASMAKSIGLIGFDGRDPSDDYFWRHGPTVQFETELSDIRLVHPGFFALDYADYYSEHIATLERVLVEIEERGIQVVPMTESHIPALRRRSVARSASVWTTPSVSGPVLVSLSPDWIGDFGHFGPFERRIHDVGEASGQSHIALASAGLRPSADWQIPSFSEATLPAGQFAPVGERFEGELRAALERLDLDTGSVVFMYTADVWHVAALLAVAAGRPELRFVANLMRSHGWIERALHEPDPWVEEVVDLLASCLAAASGTNVTVAVDTEALARDVELLTGHGVALWPMIAVSGRPPAPSGTDGRNGVMHIVAPVHAQGGKGFHDLVALAERLKGRLERRELQITARWPTAGTDKAMVRLAERFEEHGGHLVRDDLKDEEFAELVASADVALIPYRIRPFRTRTSAVAIDALLAGKPVVAVRGTWAGDLVERHGAGLTYADGDVADMERALSQVTSRIDAYRRRAAEIRSVIEPEYAPDRLITFLRSHGEPDTVHAVARPDVERLLDKADRMRRLFRWHAMSADAAQMAAAITQDDQLRTTDWLRTEVDRLRRSIKEHGQGRAAGDAGARDRSRAFSINTARRQSLRRAMNGSLRLMLAGSGLLSIAAAALAVAGYLVPAVLAVTAAVIASGLASLVVAVRLQRRP